MRTDGHTDGQTWRS